MIDKLKNDMINAMKEKDKDRLTIIRGIKAAVDKERIDNKKEITEELITDVVSHQVKLLNDSIIEFKKGNRLDLVEKAEYEMSVLKEFLPKPLEETEVDEIINEAFLKLNPESMKDMGKVMTEISPKVKGRFDMSKISTKIKNKLI